MNSPEGNKIGIICGGTDLPEFVIKSAISHGKTPTVIAIEDEADVGIASLVEDVHWLQVGNIGEAINIFKEAGIVECMMVGRVDHRRIFKNINFEPILAKVYYTLKDRKADSLLGALVKIFEENGLRFIDSTTFLKDSLVSKGTLGEMEPTDQIMEEIKFGWELAKIIGEHDIGQSVLVRERAVVCVEAIEGTDELIRRSKKYLPEGGVLVKVAKPNQDIRFDVPVIGPSTFINLAEANAAAIAVEAGRTIVVKKDECVNIANKNKMVFVGVDEDYLERF